MPDCQCCLAHLCVILEQAAHIFDIVAVPTQLPDHLFIRACNALRLMYKCNADLHTYKLQWHVPEHSHQC